MWHLESRAEGGGRWWGGRQAEYRSRQRPVDSVCPVARAPSAGLGREGRAHGTFWAWMCGFMRLSLGVDTEGKKSSL